MDKTFVRIIIWFGLMAVLTLAAMGIWLVASGGSQTTESLKWLQFLQTLATFLLPAILGAWIWTKDHRPFNWLKLNKTISWQTLLLAITIMICAIPAINLLADWNSKIILPDWLDSIEQFFKEQEEAAAELTKRFLKADSVGILIINVALMALLPALAEEISFRGTLQQLISPVVQSEKHSAKTHIAIWLTAIIFSAIHMQFYGFIPRMLMGAMFGYVFVWTGTLWAPVIMHFVNNGLAVIAYYFIDETEENTSWADTIGAGNTWWLGICSILLTIALLGLLYKQSKQKTL